MMLMIIYSSTLSGKNIILVILQKVLNFHYLCFKYSETWLKRSLRNRRRQVVA